VYVLQFSAYDSGTESSIGHILEERGLRRNMKISLSAPNYGTLSFIVGLSMLILLSGCAGGSLTTREKGAGVGALGGAAAGALIGTAVGHPGAGAAIGGGLGLGAGALIGDQLQGQEIQSQQQQQQIQSNQSELERQRLELERIKRQQEY
jgi:phage tail tape-measure protein